MGNQLSKSDGRGARVLTKMMIICEKEVELSPALRRPPAGRIALNKVLPSGETKVAAM